jgi:hypothetical protein
MRDTGWPTAAAKPTLQRVIRNNNEARGSFLNQSGNLLATPFNTVQKIHKRGNR